MQNSISLVSPKMDGSAKAGVQNSPVKAGSVGGHGVGETPAATPFNLLLSTAQGAVPGDDFISGEASQVDGDDQLSGDIDIFSDSLADIGFSGKLMPKSGTELPLPDVELRDTPETKLLSDQDEVLVTWQQSQIDWSRQSKFLGDEPAGTSTKPTFIAATTPIATPTLTPLVSSIETAPAATSMVTPTHTSIAATPPLVSTTATTPASTSTSTSTSTFKATPTPTPLVSVPATTPAATSKATPTPTSTPLVSVTATTPAATPKATPTPTPTPLVSATATTPPATPTSTSTPVDTTATTATSIVLPSVTATPRTLGATSIVTPSLASTHTPAPAPAPAPASSPSTTLSNVTLRTAGEDNWRLVKPSPELARDIGSQTSDEKLNVAQSLLNKNDRNSEAKLQANTTAVAHADITKSATGFAAAMQLRPVGAPLVKVVSQPLELGGEAGGGFELLPTSQLKVADISSSRAPVALTVTQNALTDPAWSQAMSSKISWMAGSGVHSATMQLHPAELGGIHIQLSIQGDSTSVQIQTQHRDTSELMEKMMPRLHSGMENQGLRLEEVKVSHNPSLNDNSAGNNGQQFAGHSAGDRSGAANGRGNDGDAGSRQQGLNGEDNGVSSGELNAEVILQNSGVDYYA